MANLATALCQPNIINHRRRSYRPSAYGIGVISQRRLDNRQCEKLLASAYQAMAVVMAAAGGNEKLKMAAGVYLA
jgi:hypothetical protein